MSAHVGLAVLAVAAIVLACLAWQDGRAASDANGKAGVAQEEGATRPDGGDATARSDGKRTTAGQEAQSEQIDSQDLLSGVTSGQGATRSLVEGDVGQVATRLLVSYRSEGSCVLAHAGYLDLLGCVWGCVVRGDGWVDICVVSQRDDGCQVDVTRLDVDEVEDELEVDGSNERR